MHSKSIAILLSVLTYLGVARACGLCQFALRFEAQICIGACNGLLEARESFSFTNQCSLLI